MKSIHRNIFEGELSITTQSKTPVQMLLEFKIHYKVIFKTIKDPDDNYHIEFQA